MKKISLITIFLLLTGILFFFNSFAVFAGSLIDANTTTKIDTNIDEFKVEAGFVSNGQDIGSIAETIIKSFLSLLAIIFIIMIIVAGYGWMMAGGEEAKVEKSKDTIKRAIIGLIIIVCSYLITYFVFNNIPM
jgi:hypothetical protein